MIPTSPCHIPTQVRAPSGLTLHGLDEYPPAPKIGLTEHGVKEVWSDNAYQFYPEYVSSDAWVIDIGASFGPFSFMAESFGAQVIAVEPNLPVYGCLVQNVVECGKIGRIYPAWRAVAAKRGFCTLASNLTASRIGDDARGAPLWCHVEMVTLTDLIALPEISRVDFCKIDCESSEYEVIRETPNEVLARVKRFAIELHQRFEGDEDERRTELMEKLAVTHSVEVIGGLLLARRRN